MNLPLGISLGLFLTALFVVGRAVRAVWKGEIVASGRFRRRHLVLRADSPIEFWVEIVMHVVVAVFMLAFALLFADLAPPAIRNLLVGAPRHR